ncbi:MAG TPA: hypothetical protein VNA26_02470, partial [Chitinophagaceae bacterium]|nr:hypothetical protein [Chitinophagaceae bacterium]
MPQYILPATGKSGSTFWSMILKAGLLVGTLDILAAFLDYYISTNKNPLNVFTFIASGVFGKKAFTGGSSMIILGAVFHFIIALAFTLFFFYRFPDVDKVFEEYLA